jgi:hypothetical protein
MTTRDRWTQCRAPKRGPGQSGAGCMNCNFALSGPRSRAPQVVLFLRLSKIVLPQLDLLCLYSLFPSRGDVPSMLLRAGSGDFKYAPHCDTATAFPGAVNLGRRLLIGF